MGRRKILLGQSDKHHLDIRRLTFGLGMIVGFMNCRIRCRNDINYRLGHGFALGFALRFALGFALGFALWLAL